MTAATADTAADYGPDLAPVRHPQRHASLRAMTAATDDKQSSRTDRWCGMTRDEYIDRVVAKAPPLTATQIAKLSTLFETDASQRN